ncbi:MAG: hypothetical protein V3U54_03380 [Thermodesulfobacteriota bacterium]
MINEHDKDRIIRYLSGDLVGEELISVEKLISEKLEYKEYYENLKRSWEALEHIEDIEPKGNYVSDFWNKVEMSESKTNTGYLNFFRSRRTGWTLVGSFVSILIIGVFIFSLFSSRNTNVSFTDLDKRDEMLLIDVDNSISRNVTEILEVYGPWNIK